MIYFVSIIFLAGLIQSFAGFGAGLFSIPLLTLFLEPKFIIPPCMLLFLIMNLSLTMEIRKNVKWGKVLKFLPGTITGIPGGVYALEYLNPEIIKGLISLVVIFFAIFFSSGGRLSLKETFLSQNGAGLIGGFLAGCSSMGGPPIIIFGISLGWRKEAFRSTLVAYFLIMSVLALLSFTIAGLFSFSNLRLFFAGIIPLFCGFLLGIKLKNITSEEKFRKAILWVLITIGIIGLIGAMF
jgi:uncharacterized membrane protein YfcA